MSIEKVISTSSNIEKDSFIWNISGSLLMAFQSVIFLMIITRTADLSEAGIFTIAYAIANMFLMIGKYGMRYFQVSDVKEEYSFEEYLVSRKITTVLMLVASILYIIKFSGISEYSIYKIWIVLWMCLNKIIDSMEDVYCGLYQQKGRLDVGAKILTIRMLLVITSYGVVMIIYKNQLTALVVSTLVSAIISVLFIHVTFPLFKDRKKTYRISNVKKLLQQCSPIFAGSFLLYYIGNAPKYAIDLILPSEEQACYGFIAMPVFVIGLLSGFIFNPMLVKITILWERNRIRLFVYMIYRQIIIICAITAMCVVGAYFCGVQVLSIMYNTDISYYKSELLILLLGGGMLGISSLLSAVLTIVRCQKYLVWIYGIIAIFAYLSFADVVTEYGIKGASVTYAILMFLLSLCLAICLAIKIFREVKQDK